MKKVSKAFLNKICKRTVCFLLVSAIFLNNCGYVGLLGIKNIASYISAKAEIITPAEPDSADIVYDSEGNITSVIVRTAANLLWLAERDANKYQSATITIVGGNNSDSFGKIIDSFSGLGSQTAPYEGTFQIAEGSALYLYSNHALFNYISDKAEIKKESTTNGIATIEINRTSNSDISAPALLAENIVHDPSVSEDTYLFQYLNLEINYSLSDSESIELKDFGGIIGTVDSECQVQLNVKNVASAGVTSDNTVGLACCTLGDNAKLIFSYDNYSENNSYDVVSSNGDAGGLVGKMGSGSTLTVKNAFSYTGDVTAASGNAGGLVGAMGSGATVEIADGGTTQYSGTIIGDTNAGGLAGVMESEASLTVNGSYSFSGTAQAENVGGLIGSSVDENLAITGLTTISGTVKGTQNAGGLIGQAEYLNAKLIDATNTATSGLKVDDVSVSGTNCGGLFGKLTNSGTNSKIEINGSVSSKAADNSANYGGLIGVYKATSLEQELYISGISVTSDRNGKTINTFGGLIGTLDGDTTGAYVKLSGNVTVNTTGTNERLTNYGGIVGNGGNEGNFIDITGGTTTITAASGYNGTKTGGLVGTMTSGVLRLNGTVDLSGAKPNGTGPGHGSIMGYRANTLVYSDSGYSLTRHSSVGNVDDIGQWGEVVKFSGVGGSNTIVYSDTAHTVTIKKHTDLTTVSSNEDLARLALYIQLNTEGNKGALRFDDDTLISASLLNSTITVGANVSFAGTGLTALTRDDGSNANFTGTLNGGGNTITLAVGDTTANGYRGRIYSHSHCGLLATTGDGATIQNLTIGGAMNVYSESIPNTKDNTAEYGARVGSLIAHHMGNSTSDADALTIKNVTIKGTINCSGQNKGKTRIGGLIGDVDGGRVDLGTETEKCIIACTIENTGGNQTCANSGLICQSENATININNVQFSSDDTAFKMEITSDNSATIGGFLGYEWLDTNAYINKVVVGTTEKQATFEQKSGSTPNLAGLIYKATGFVQLNDLNFANALIKAANKPDSFGVIINDGKQAYLEVTNTNYYGINGLTLTFDTPKVYDEFVAYTNNKSDIADNGNGVVSLPTKDRSGIATDNIYTNRITDYESVPNSKTRYYYNIDQIRLKNRSYLSDGEQLLLWSLSHYANTCTDKFSANLDDQFKANEIHGTCNLTGLSYYPINIPDNKTVTILTGTEVQFDSKALAMNGETDATIKANNQIFMMQCGLFRDMKSTKGEDIRKLTIEGSLTLSGAIGNRNDRTSGALFCGTVEGAKPGGSLQAFSADIVCNASTEIILKDLYVRGYTGGGSAPLLIGKIGNYVSINLVGVKTYVGAENSSNVYGLPDGQNYAASSLIGNVGGAEAQSVNISFSKIALDSRKTADGTLDSYYGTSKSIFSHATLLESFMFADNSGSTGTYDFEITEDWTSAVSPFTAKHQVTYGYEITHSKEYENKEKCYLKDNHYVSPVLQDGNTYEYDFVLGSYLPYVCNSPATDNETYSTDNKYHELKVNVPATNFEGGCGTYGDPYRITDAAQLVTLAKILENETFDTGYEICYPNSITNKDCIYSTAENHTEYKYENGAFTKVSGTGSSSIDSTTMYHYLRDAYYIIENNITLGSDFKGLGIENAYQIFRGVIVGKQQDDDSYPTITMECDTPLVTISGGCVVKDLNIVYNTDVVITEETGGLFKPTNVNNSSIAVGCQYFGGVIGQVLAGDNIIDNVDVSFATGKKITLKGSKNYLVPVGAYVGVVRNGGLIFRSMNGKNTLSTANLTVYANTSSNELDTALYDFSEHGMDDTNYLYINRYVGRVLDGYVVTDDEGDFGNSDLNNGDKNYSIVNLNPDESDKLSLTLSDDKKLQGLPKNDTGFAWSNIQVPNAQSLFVLSAIVASGAAAYQSTDDAKPIDKKDFYYYLQTSYYLGNTHLAKYTNVQGVTEENKEGDFKLSKGDVSGKNKDGDSEASNSIPYIVKYYTAEQTTYKQNDNKGNKVEILDKYPTRIICSTNTRFSITLTGKDVNDDPIIYDMPKGFRGINAMYNNTSYSTNPDRQVINAFGFNGNGNTVNMDMHIMSYGENDAYNPFGVGLFPRIQQNTSGQLHGDVTTALQSNDYSKMGKNLQTYKDTYAVEDLTITGSLSYDVPTQNGIRVTDEFIVKNNNIITKQTVNVGGYAGRNYDSRQKTLYYWFDNVTVNATLSGGYGTGGLIGAIGNFENGTNGFDGINGVSSANVQTVVANNISSSGLNVSGYKYAGGLFGIVYKSTSGVFVDCSNKTNAPIKVTSITAEAAGNRCGGLIGTAKNNVNLIVTNTKVTNKTADIKGIIGETDEENFQKAQYAGGLAGYVNGSAKVTNASVSKLSVNVSSNIDSNYAGGMIGYVESTGAFSECSVEDSFIYVRNNHSGNVGGLCGRINDNANLENITIKKNTIKINNNNIQKNDNIHSRIGGVIGSLNKGDLNGFNMLLCDNTFEIWYNNTTPSTYKSNTYYGNWVGLTNSKLVKLVAVSKQGDHSKYLEKDLGGTPSNLNSNNYIIYADYDGSAVDGNDNGTDAKSPYVHVNPLSTALNALPKMDDTSGCEIVTGDGAVFGGAGYESFAMSKKIIDEAKTNTTDYTTYSKIKNFADDKFYFEGTNQNVLTFNTQVGNDNTKLGTTSLSEATYDFPVLLIQSSDSDALTQFVTDYISVLTNETNISINKFEVKTYKWDGENWTDVNNSLSVKNDTTLKPVAGKYDNEKAQFTMIKATFNSPVSDSNDTFSLYIPVIVKKVLQFKVETKVASDTKYFTDDYSHGTVVENHGVPVTTLITYSYCNNTYQDWIENINAGENYFWNFDKSIMYRQNVGAKYLPDGSEQDGTTYPAAKVTLVDKNNNDIAYYGTLSDVGVFTQSNGEITFNKLKEYDGTTEFSPVTLAELLCEQLELTAYTPTGSEEDTKFVEIPKANVDVNDPTGANVPTIIAYLNGEKAYFRPMATEESSSETPPTAYAIKIGLDSYTKTNVIDITEQYYLTLKTDKNIEDLFYVQVGYTPNSLSGGNLATNNITATGETDDLVLANFFKQENFKTKTTSNEEIQNSSSQIATSMSVDIVFNEKNRSSFALYANNIDLNQGFILSYVKYIKDEDQNFTKVSQSILENTKITGTYSVEYGANSVDATINETLSESCIEYLLKCPDKDTVDNPIKLKDLFVNDNSKITLKADFNISFTNFDDNMLMQQFPLGSAGSNIGLVVCGKSNIAYDSSELQNSTVSTGSAVEDGTGYSLTPKRYYITKSESAKLTYDAVDEDTGDSLGKISQLGINANELFEQDSVRINALGIYDASILTEEPQATTMLLEFKLVRKNKSSNSYENDSVKISDYLQNFKLTVLGAETIAFGSDLRTYTAEVNWQTVSGGNGSAKISTSFDVLTGASFEDKQYLYSNYDLILTVKLKKSDGTVITGSIQQDHIVYTNCRIYTDII